MPNSLHRSAIASPASRRATNCILSSIAEHSFQGIVTSSLNREKVLPMCPVRCVTYVPDRSSPLSQSFKLLFPLHYFGACRGGKPPVNRALRCASRCNSWLVPSVG